MAYHMDRKLKEAQHKLELYVTKLEGLSPLAKLKKGYALVRTEDGVPLQSIKNVEVNEMLNSLTFGRRYYSKGRRSRGS